MLWGHKALLCPPTHGRKVCQDIAELTARTLPKTPTRQRISPTACVAIGRTCATLKTLRHPSAWPVPGGGKTTACRFDNDLDDAAEALDLKSAQSVPKHRPVTAAGA
jgi:hypothetical protein